MQRRQFLSRFVSVGAAGAAAMWLPRLSLAQSPQSYRRLLILIELKGGNDALNTVVPLRQYPRYRELRPVIGIAPQRLLPLKGYEQDFALNPGLSAFAEHALGTSDTDAASGPGAFSSAFVAGSGFTLTTRRNLRADDVTLRAEFSTDLALWRPASLAAIRPAGDGVATETWEVVDSGQSAVFLRLRVTRP